jgi:hypothetical protein
MVVLNMETNIWIYFSKTGTGYELKGDDIISAFDAFINMDGTFLIEFSFSPIKNDMNFFIYEWDKSQRKRKTIYENYRKEIIIMGLLNNIELPTNVQQKILSLYVNDAEELELEKNANS